MNWQMHRHARLAAKMLRKGRALAEQLHKVNAFGKEEYLPMEEAVVECKETAKAVLSLLRK